MVSSACIPQHGVVELVLARVGGHLGSSSVVGSLCEAEVVGGKFGAFDCFEHGCEEGTMSVFNA